MEVEQASRIRTAHFVVLIVLLALIVAGLAAMIAMTSQAAGAIQEPAMRKLLARLAWVSAAVLGFAVLLLFWAIMRFFQIRSSRPGKRSRTAYVDAWALAGQRFKLPEHQAEDEEDDDQEQ